MSLTGYRSVEEPELVLLVLKSLTEILYTSTLITKIEIMN
ncbi:16639_t:CDS:2 [Funneliformis mosseae]|uniref:16639_t:CDS:1 n=1 Tax=Funneliformis mosseae TaxID=27381 RepID=A0A9N9E954_FUNMO|nr:16639_t:CDS:2 [Funneliformis mosseae]